MKYRQKQPVVAAIKWTGTNLREVIDFIGLHPSAKGWTWEEYEQFVAQRGLKIFNAHGSHIVSIGDYIINGITGPWACSSASFESTWVEAEIIDWVAEERKFAGGGQGLIPWLIIEAMTSLSPNINDAFPDLDGSNLSVEMKINGVAVPVRTTLEAIEQQLDKLVLEKAEELINTKFIVHERVLDALREHVVSQLKDGYVKDSLSDG